MQWNYTVPIFLMFVIVGFISHDVYKDRLVEVTCDDVLYAAGNNGVVSTNRHGRKIVITFNDYKTITYPVALCEYE